MASRTRGKSEKPAASDEHTSRPESPSKRGNANAQPQSTESSRDAGLPRSAAGIDFQPPPSRLPRASPTRQVITEATSQENSERQRRADPDPRQQHRPASSRPPPPPPPPWASHEGQGQQHYQAGAMPFPVPRSQQVRNALLCDLGPLERRVLGQHDSL
jgi:hypothetical protein